MLALIQFLGLDVVQANGAKAIIIAIYTAAILVVFSWAGQVVWSYGLLVGAGGVLGSWLGTRAVIEKGASLVRRRGGCGFGVGWGQRIMDCPG